MFIGLVLSAASVYQMVRGFIIVVVAIYSRLFLNRNLFRHQLAGVAITLFGVIIVGISSILHESHSAENPVLGIIILIIAQFFAGLVFVSEELFLGNINVDPLQAVGIEGMAGMLYYIVLLPIMYAIPCQNRDLCSRGRIEDFVNAFYQLGSNYVLMLCWWGTMIAFAFFN